MAIEALVFQVSESAFAGFMRSASWAYPLANVAHLLELALLAGGILAVDVRILGFWQKLPMKAVHDALTPFAVAGLLIFAVSGTGLFAADAKELARNPVFLSKMVIVALAVVNALTFRRFASEALTRSGSELPLILRVSAVASLSLWSAAVICGRMIAY